MMTNLHLDGYYVLSSHIFKNQQKLVQWVELIKRYVVRTKKCLFLDHLAKN